MILTKGHCDPPFLSQLGFGEGVRGWWVGVLDFLGILELGLERALGAICVLGGFSRNMRSKLKTSINIQKFNSDDRYV